MSLTMVLHLVPMLAKGLEPCFYLMAAIAVTIAALHCRSERGRMVLFPITYTLTLASFFTIKPTTKYILPPNLDYALGITCIVNLIILPRILLFGEHGLDSTLYATQGLTGWIRPSKESLRATSRIWNNPRGIRSNDTRNHQQTQESSLFAFFFRQCVRIVVICLMHTYVWSWLVQPVFLDMELDDLTPTKEALVRRVLLSPSEIDIFEVKLRLVLPFHWVWMNYAFLECYHSLLSIIFVCLLGWDRSEEWPPLYGSILEAYTVRRFWGVFWHRITTRNMTSLAQGILSRIGLENFGAKSSKAAVAGMIFAVSGVAHALVAWRTGEGFEGRDVAFFLANFACIAAERMVSRVYGSWTGSRAYGKSPQAMQHSVSLTYRIMGLLWVYTWLVLVLPKWQYPKLHAQRHEQLKWEVDFLLSV